MTKLVKYANNLQFIRRIISGNIINTRMHIKQNYTKAPQNEKWYAERQNRDKIRSTATR